MVWFLQLVRLVDPLEHVEKSFIGKWIWILDDKLLFRTFFAVSFSSDDRSFAGDRTKTRLLQDTILDFLDGENVTACCFYFDEVMLRYFVKNVQFGEKPA